MTLPTHSPRLPRGSNKPKLIDEYVGRVNSGHEQVSIAHMRSPGGWLEPGQKPEFDEFTVVLRGYAASGAQRLGQSMCAPARRWLPTAGNGSVTARPPEGAEYIAVCLPAFSTAERAPRYVTTSKGSQR